MKMIMITNDNGFLVSVNEYETIKIKVEIALFVINNSVYVPFIDN